MNEGDVVLLQNTRFRGAEETKNGEEFSKELADLADDYVCDAFGSSHRAHASVAGVTKFITAKGGSNVVGYLMQKEIDFLGNAVENPVRPFVAILGGAKVADKLNVISNLLEKCDTLIIGGGMAYTFLKAQGYEIGKSLVDDAYYWNELSKCVSVYCDLKQHCDTLDSLNIGGGFPIKSSLLQDYDYEYMAEEVISQIKSICQQRGVKEPNIFTEFGSFTVGESGATIFQILDQKQQNDKSCKKEQPMLSAPVDECIAGCCLIHFLSPAADWSRLSAVFSESVEMDVA